MVEPVKPEVFWIEFEDGDGRAGRCGGTIPEGTCGEAFCEPDALETRVGFDDEAFCEPDALETRVGFDGEVLSVAVRARRRATLKSCTVYLRHAFSPDERIVMNGYQSWTDTHPCTPSSVMRGLNRVPKGIVNRFTLDGSGDYRFVRYDEKPGHLHGFTYATFGEPDGLVLLASLDEGHGFTKIYAECGSGALSLETECPARALEAGEEVELGRYAIIRGAEQEAFDRWFELMGIEPRPSTPLVGYTSWYRHYGAIDAQKIKHDLEAAVGFEEFDTGGATLLFQIDDGYCKVGDWLEVDEGKFPKGLKPLAKKARKRGFLPGLWLAPFVCERDSSLAARHPDWLLRDEDGKTVATGSHWSGGLALDTLNPAVRSYVCEVVRTAVEKWGFGLLKLDFLYAACMFPHGGMNRGELMRDGTELLREAAGDECLLLGCGVPLASAFGRFEYCRIGCDVGLDWDDVPYMRLLHRERVSTKNSRANTIAREPLDGRAFRNDPDVFFLRDDVKLTKRQRLALIEADAANASMLLTSDDLSGWGPAERGAFATALAKMLAREERRNGKDGRWTGSM